MARPDVLLGEFAHQCLVQTGFGAQNAAHCIGIQPDVFDVLRRGVRRLDVVKALETSLVDVEYGHAGPRRIAAGSPSLLQHRGRRAHGGGDADGVALRRSTGHARASARESPSALARASKARDDTNVRQTSWARTAQECRPSLFTVPMSTGESPLVN